MEKELETQGKQEKESVVMMLTKSDKFNIDEKTNKLYVSFETLDGQIITCWIRDEMYIKHLIRKYYNLTKKVMQSNRLKDILNTIESIYFFDAEKKRIYNRVAKIDEKVIYNMADDKNTTYTITKDGCEETKDESNMFIFHQHQKEQVKPIKPENIRETLKLIFKYVNVNPKQKILFLVTLIVMLISDILYPLIIFFGEPGSGKTTACRIFKDLIDPSINGLLSVPRNEDEVYQCIAENHITTFDNISHINNKLSDTICKIITKICFYKRKNFTDGDSVTFSPEGAIILNGIEIVAHRSDLLDRSILFEILKASEDDMKSSSELMEEYEKDKPYILGAMFEALSKALKLYETIKIKNFSRLGEFEKFGFCIAESIHEGHGEKFIKQYKNNKQIQNEEVINSNPFACAIIDFVSINKGIWQGTPSKLLTELNEIKEFQAVSKNSSTWPTYPNVVTRKLSAIKSDLLKAGVNYIDEGHKTIGRKIRLEII